MHSPGRWNPSRRLRSRTWAAAVAGALALSVAGYTAPAGASPAASHQPQLPGAVSPTPAAGTPALINNTGNTKDQIRQMVQCGDTMYAVGSFSQVTQGGSTIPRTNVFSFSATAPYTITSWAPAVNGIVNSIAFNPADPTCSDAYIGGDFSNVNGTPVKDIAEIDTTAGDVVPGFGTSTAGGQVETLLAVDNHLLVGGHFTWINGSHADPYFASVSPLTGKDDGFVHLQISGYYNYCGNGSCTSGKSSSVYNQQLSHGGTLDLVEGDFTSVGGLARQQIFMLNLATSPATVTGWTSPEWDGSKGNLPGGYPYQCMPVEAFYIRSAAWSPDDQTVYIATTGFHPVNLPTGSYPRSGLCDAAAAFPATQTSVTHLWVNYTGCDSYYSVAADDSAVYVAGHQRWSENPKGCNHAGPGAIPDPGLQGLDPATGALELRPDNSPVYSMSRANADNMLITSTGLWISSTNRYGSQYCGRIPGHSGICLLPYPGA
jgi:hypothetical protein